MNNFIQKTSNFNPDYTVHPGEILLETLEMLNMSQVELSKRINRPEKTISEIINGLASITPETALQFEKALSIPASFWNNLETNYQARKAKIKFDDNLNSEVDLSRKFPYKEMVKNGWIKATRKEKEKIENLLEFFGVSSLSLIPKVMNINFRQHKGKNISYEAIATWIRKGEIDSQQSDTMPFDPIKLKQNLNDFKQLTTLNPQEFIPILTQKLSECGVVLVFTKSLPNTYICGATKWINPNKALIQLSLRGSFADIMWFTLYHEVAHLILHSKKEKFIDIENFKEDRNDLEIQADTFASEQLIPNSVIEDFIKSNTLTRLNINTFATSLKVHTGIVAGRLVHDEKLTYKEANLYRTRYKWTNDD